jgi:NAD(P)-dependent dehydrogenase (short-subunit alcohol dehydrogenase family)
MSKLAGKVAIVTGAASGMGREITYKFLRENCKVVATDINDDRLDELKKEAPDKGVNLHTIITDVSDEKEVQRLVAAAILQFGHVDILVNDAGLMDNFEGVAEVTNEQWNRIINVNLHGPFLLMRTLLPHFIHRKSGNIINISSIGGIQGARAGAAYTTSKFALNGLTKNTGYLYGKMGIRCNAIAPGAIETHISESIDFSKVSKEMSELSMAGQKLNPRTGKPTEIAEIALFLASDDSSFINGEIIVADGGWTAY